MEDLSNVIEQLLTQADMTEVEITDELNRMGIEVTQATINRIKNRKFQKTSFDIGSGLLQLRDQRIAHRV
jgi:arginine repressor